MLLGMIVALWAGTNSAQFVSHHFFTHRTDADEPDFLFLPADDSDIERRKEQVREEVRSIQDDLRNISLNLNGGQERNWSPKREEKEDAKWPNNNNNNEKVDEKKAESEPQKKDENINIPQQQDQASETAPPQDKVPTDEQAGGHQESETLFDETDRKQRNREASKNRELRIEEAIYQAENARSKMMLRMLDKMEARIEARRQRALTLEESLFSDMLSGDDAAEPDGYYVPSFLFRKNKTKPRKTPSLLPQ